jgi:hypothetical protein
MHGYVRPRALEISASVAFSVSLTLTPPKPRKPPSEAASATNSAICCSQALKAFRVGRGLGVGIAAVRPRSEANSNDGARNLQMVVVARVGTSFSAKRGTIA